MTRIGTDQLREAVLDEGSFVSWDTEPRAIPTSESYARELAEAREASGRDESVLTGEGRVCGRRVAVVVCEFDFLAGSIGVAAAERITVAIQRATAERLPLLASPSSGGTRMQEGHRRVPADGQDRRGRHPAQAGHTCPTWSTCATRRPAGCSRRGARWVTSPSPSRAR